MNQAAAVYRTLADAVRGRKTYGEVLGVSREEMHGLAGTGTTLLEQGQLDDARAVFEGLVTLDPGVAYSHLALGAVYQRSGRGADGIAAYTKALSLDPKLSGAHANRGELLLAAGEREKGLLDLRRALELDPETAEPSTVRARALLGVIDRHTKRQKKPAKKSET